MNDVLQVIFSSRFFLSAFVFITLSILINWLGLWLQQQLHEHPFNDWLAEHIGIPLLNAVAMILFVVILYPALFPQEGLPGFSHLLFTESGRMNQLINWVFVLSLMIPMIPIVGPRIEIVLPIQGIVVIALITNWLRDHLNAPGISLIPSGLDFLFMLAWGIAAAMLAVGLARKLGEIVDEYYHVAHSASFMYPILALLLQTPTLVVYARGVMAS